jgi:hypothetical protein
MGIEYNNPKIVTDGLVLALDAANPKSYPGSGTTWSDLVGSNDGTLTNGPTFDSGNSGSFVFDGANDHISTPLAFTQSSNTYSYTVMVTAKLTNLSTGTRMSILASDNTGFDWGFGATSRSGDIAAGETAKYKIFTGNSIEKGSFVDTNWHILIAQWDSTASEVRLYVDNVLDISYSGIGYDSSINAITAIGGSPVYNEYWPGNIANTFIYNRILTDAEMTQNYNATRGRFGI